MREKGAHIMKYFCQRCVPFSEHTKMAVDARRDKRWFNRVFLHFHLLCAQSEKWCWNNKKKSKHVHRRRPNGNETVTFNLSNGERMAERCLRAHHFAQNARSQLSMSGFHPQNQMEERNLPSHGCLYTAHPPPVLPLVAHRRYLFTHYFHLVRLAASYVGSVHDRQRDSRSLRAQFSEEV